MRTWLYPIGTLILVGTTLLVTLAGLYDALPALQKAVYRTRNPNQEGVGTIPNNRLSGYGGDASVTARFESDETFYNFSLELRGQRGPEQAALSPSPPPPANTLGRAAGSKCLLSRPEQDYTGALMRAWIDQRKGRMMSERTMVQEKAGKQGGWVCLGAKALGGVEESRRTVWV